MAKAKTEKRGRGRPRRESEKVGKKLSIDSQIGAKLRALREAKKLGVYELAALSGVSYSAIYEIEAGATKAKLETLVALDRHLGGKSELVAFAVSVQK